MERRCSLTSERNSDRNRDNPSFSTFQHAAVAQRKWGLMILSGPPLYWSVSAKQCHYIKLHPTLVSETDPFLLLSAIALPPLMNSSDWLFCHSDRELLLCTCLVPQFSPNFTIQKEDFSSHQNVGKCMEYWMLIKSKTNCTVLLYFARRTF
jgi:hypothetical protein